MNENSSSLTPSILGIMHYENEMKMKMKKLSVIRPPRAVEAYEV